MVNAAVEQLGHKANMAAQEQREFQPRGPESLKKTFQISRRDKDVLKEGRLENEKVDVRPVA